VPRLSRTPSARWPTSIGISDRLASEWVADLRRNTQTDPLLMDLPIHCDPGVQPNLLRLARWGTEVITLFMVGKIKRMHLRDKQSMREIARRTELSRSPAP